MAAAGDVLGRLLGALDTLRLRRAQALLIYLAMSAGIAHRSEKIADLFWQDSDTQKALTSCRQAVRHIRRGLADAGGAGIALDSGGGNLSLRIEGGFSLKDAIRAPLTAVDWDAAAAENIRRFLAYLGRMDGISSSFDSWVVISRAEITAFCISALDETVESFGPDRLGDLRQAAEFAIEIEPANETAVRLLMTLDWQSGHATRAIERYDALYGYLDAEFDQEPEAETIELLAAIKLNPARRADPARVTQRRPQVTLAVTLAGLPGAPLEADSLATVLYADLRMRMGRFREWIITDEGGREAAQFNVLLRPVIAAGVRRLFVDVQSTADQQFLWSEVIETPEQDWESKIRGLLSNIATSLSVVLSDRSLSASGMGVYDRWLKAQSILDDWSPRTEGEAMAMLQRITEEEPRFGPAHAELAAALNVRHVLLPGTRQTDATRDTALRHAIMAITIDPLDTRAHRAVAWCYCHKQEFGLAEFHFEQSLNLNRSNPMTLASAAMGLAFAGNLTRAADLVAEAKRYAATLQPYHSIYLAAADYLLGDYAAALPALEAGRGMMTTVGGWHSLALWQLGRRAEAQDRMRHFQDEIARAWQGEAPADPAAVIDWFCDCFPLRDAAARQDMRRLARTIASL